MTRAPPLSAVEFELSAGIAVLQRTPATLRVLLGGLSADWTTANEGPETWSPYDVVGHLIHGERTDLIPRARIILKRIPRVMARQYREAIGPWPEYLTVVDR
jgi:hypothetical protein